MRDKAQRDAATEKLKNFRLGCKWKCLCAPRGFNFNFHLHLIPHIRCHKALFHCLYSSFGSTENTWFIWSDFDSKLMCTSPSSVNFTYTKTAKCHATPSKSRTECDTKADSTANIQRNEMMRKKNRTQRIEAAMAKWKYQSSITTVTGRRITQLAKQYIEIWQTKRKNQRFQFLVDHTRAVWLFLCLCLCLCMFCATTKLSFSIWSTIECVFLCCAVFFSVFLVTVSNSASDILFDACVFFTRCVRVNKCIHVYRKSFRLLFIVTFPFCLVCPFSSSSSSSSPIRFASLRFKSSSCPVLTIFQCPPKWHDENKIITIRLLRDMCMW